MSKRKICVITGSRAEYGLQYWLLKEIQKDPSLVLQLIVTGTHLSPAFGLTYKVIEEDGFEISAKVDLELKDDSPVELTKSMGKGLARFGEAFQLLNPEIVVFLGDRYEILMAAVASMMARIPMAHIHGGEVTEGAIDDSIRHSLTKMSHLHFVAADIYRNRVIQLGENPDRVFNTGTMALDNISKIQLLDREAFENEIRFRLGNLNFLVTYHPVTLHTEGPGEAMTSLLAALDSFPEAKIIFTMPNADSGGLQITDKIKAFVEKNPERAVAHTSLGQLKYLSAIRNVDVVIGNSSSGLVEAPPLKKPTVNVGDRQKGRLMASSVISTGETTSEIIAATKQALSPEFQKTLSRISAPYGLEGGASVRIKEILKNARLEGLIRKSFYDLDFDEHNT
jgi:UDP-hydrolysing UDP-N-acetyl-D-glucosamine 2-epimerase